MESPLVPQFGDLSLSDHSRGGGPLKIIRIPFQKRRLVSLGGATRRDQLAHLVKPLEILLIRKKKICVYQMLVAYMIPQEQKDGNGKVSRSSVSWLLLMYVHLPE
ncbi:hypothetical protein SETIT_7G251200v2 [Setaria italica]|uniref:Uncharacterized protein n=1 Tax=Setaria italica TaxID=4555 RepID=A0A368S167_SETIT|nr:hypothetical protein SETIT_7G251200v2 [Setaria italica]